MMHGMLRIRERGGLLTRADGKVSGRLTYVPETLSGGNRAPPEFQIDVPLGPREFRVLLDLGRAGRLPHKVFMQARCYCMRELSRGFAKGVNSHAVS